MLLSTVVASITLLCALHLVPPATAIGVLAAALVAAGRLREGGGPGKGRGAGSDAGAVAIGLGGGAAAGEALLGLLGG